MLQPEFHESPWKAPWDSQSTGGCLPRQAGPQAWWSGRSRKQSKTCRVTSVSRRQSSGFSPPFHCPWFLWLCISRELWAHVSYPSLQCWAQALFMRWVPLKKYFIKDGMCYSAHSDFLTPSSFWGGAATPVLLITTLHPVLDPPLPPPPVTESSQALSVGCKIIQWIWDEVLGSGRDFIQESADQEDGRLAPQNNHGVRAWSPGSLMGQR